MRKLTKLLFCCSVLLFGFNFRLWADNQPIPILMYAYQLESPFITDLSNKEGISFELANYLNEKQSVYEISVQYLPRNRVRKYLEGREPAIVILTNKNWDNDPEATKYYWSGPIMLEKKYYIWNSLNPLNFNGVESLNGLKFGSVQGYSYAQLDSLVKNKQIQFEYANTEYGALKMLMVGRVDFSEVSLSRFLTYIAEEKGVEGRFILNSTPNYQITRDILFTKEYKEFYLFINPIINNMHNDIVWHRVIESYIGERFRHFLPN